jgi:D-proline reductase (dithiol) PrdB
VLARLFEAAGMSTILVTNMPFWAERVGAPRTLAVEFPFGHILGRPGDRALQMRVIDHALGVLETAEGPGTIAHFQERWPESLDEALQRCHPVEPPPIMGQMGRHIGSLLRAMRRGAR